jgi:hypothetical protein
MLNELINNLKHNDKLYHIIYGKTMSGKTTLLQELIKTNLYDFIELDCFTIHKFDIQSITKYNILLLLESYQKEKCFVFDDFDKLYSQNNTIVNDIISQLYKLKYKCIFTISNKNFKGSGIINKKKNYYYTLEQIKEIYTSTITNNTLEEKLKTSTHNTFQQFLFTFENEQNIELFLYENTNPFFTINISNYDIYNNLIHLYYYTHFINNTIKFPKLISINKKLKIYNDIDFYRQFINGKSNSNKRNTT